MLTKIALTSSSELRSLTASVIWSPSALPPTSRKLAGCPPYKEMISIVDIARPAPFTKQPMFPPI